MNILLINTTDTKGGAARAAYRLHKGLKCIGINSKMLVKDKFSESDISIIRNKSFRSFLIGKLALLLEIILLKFFLKTKNETLHSLALLSSLNINEINKINHDLIHLHWICNGFVSIGDLKKIKGPIIWTLHDMWAFCGAEHYSGETERYINGYNKKNRPVYERGLDLNKWIWQMKRSNWNNLNLTIVTPSRWLAECVRKSNLMKKYRVEVIPNGINTDIFKPIDKKYARDVLNLPQDKKLILFGAMSATKDKRKGFHLLKKALNNIYQNSCDYVDLVVFGSSGDNEKDLGFNVHYLGKIKDENMLSLVYSASDVFVLPSLEDNLPNTVMESLSCGNPVVGFNIGGIPDMIDHKSNGYLVEYKDVFDLSKGIEWVLNNPRYDEITKNARRKVEDNFDANIISKRYEELYKSVLNL